MGAARRSTSTDDAQNDSHRIHADTIHLKESGTTVTPLDPQDVETLTDAAIELARK